MKREVIDAFKWVQMLYVHALDINTRSTDHVVREYENKSLKKFFINRSLW